MNLNRRYADEAFLWNWERSLKRGDAVLCRFWDETVKREVEHPGTLWTLYKYVAYAKLADGRKVRLHRCKPTGYWMLTRGIFPPDWEERCRKMREQMGE